MNSPITGTTKKPTMPTPAPTHWVEAGMPASLRCRLGTKYFTTLPASRTTAATAKTAQAVAPPTCQAQTRTAPSTRIEPGRTGTRIPTRPTAMARATRTSNELIGLTLSHGRGPLGAAGQGPGAREGGRAVGPDV